MSLINWIAELSPWAWVVGACCISAAALFWAVIEE